MIAASGQRVGRSALVLLAASAVLVPAVPVAVRGEQPLFSGELPLVRRIKVPAQLPEVWPKGDWQPFTLSEFERRMRLAESASRGRPDTFLERAEYTATVTGAELTDARLEWSVRRTDAGPRLLSLGRLNLNVANLEWSDPDLPRPELETRRVSEGAVEWRDPAFLRPKMPALWGTDPAGITAIVIDRPRGKLVGDWNVAGRPLAASTEFDVELCPAEISRLTLRVPSGLVLTASAGELSAPTAAAQSGWNEWRLNLGSRTSCRLRLAAPPDATLKKPLVLVRSSLNYFVKPEAVRVLGDFEIDVLESSRRELRLMVDPDVQVTAVEIGDDSATLWRTAVTSAGQEVVVSLPDPISGAGHTLQIQGIAQVKQFAAWSLPRIRVQEAVEVSERVTLGLQPPFLPADIRADGYRQIELSSGADEGEVLVFRQIRSDGAITIVPTDMKAELTCRAVTHIQADPQQWSMESEWEWQAASGSTFAASCVVPETWEVVDVRPAGGELPRELSGWEVQATESGRQILQLYFLNALKPGRPHSVHISVRRLPPAAGEPASVPPLVPAENSEIEQIVVVTAGSDWRPVVETAPGIERLSIRDIPAESLRLDFLRARLSQHGARSVVLKAVGTNARGSLHVEQASPGSDSNQPPERVGDEKNTRGSPSPSRGRDPHGSASEAQTGQAGNPVDSFESPVALAVRVEVSGLEPGYDHYVAEYHIADAARSRIFGWRLPQSTELLGVYRDGRRIVPEARQNAYFVELPISGQTNDADNPSATLQIVYRVVATMNRGPNSRRFVLPQTDRPVLHFDLTLITPDDIRLERPLGGISLTNEEARQSWRHRLWGALAGRDDRSVFNPFNGSDWLSVLHHDAADSAKTPGRTVWRVATAPPPSAEAGFVIWRAREVTWLSWVLVFAALLAGLVARLREMPLRRIAAVAGLAGLALAALTLSPVFAELAGSALAGLVLALFLPHRFLIFPSRPASEDEVDLPVGSTQSFISLTSLALASGAIALALAVQAQEKSAPPAIPALAEHKANRPLANILIPIDEDGMPAGKEPLVYATSELLALLKQFASSAAMPDYLIGASAFEGTVDEANRLLVTARFDIHVFPGRPLVPVRLALGAANLGGDDACLVDGRPHPVRTDADGRGLIVGLAGPEPLPDSPELPHPNLEADSIRTHEPGRWQSPGDEVVVMRTYKVVLRLYPTVAAGQGDLFTAALSIPRGCRSQASLSSRTAFAIMGIAPIDAAQPAPRTALSVAREAILRPGPTNQLVFFWSRTATTVNSPAVESNAVGRSQKEAGVSCLADVSGSLIQMHYHVAYRVAAGRVDSLLWRIPAGFVLQSIQAPQLAGYRFVPVADAGRNLLIEFSKPQHGDFSLSAKFAFAIDQNQRQISLPLVNPLGGDGAAPGDVGLQFHHIAVRQPSELRVTVMAAHPGQSLKARPVDEFLREWNAGGARPQQAFELDRSFDLNVAIDNLAAGPLVHGSSVARLQSNRLDWTYSAEVSPNAVPQFVYRLIVDPRLTIKSISVQEDGAERLLRWSQMRDAVILFLNDRATRAQPVRIDASLPVAASQELELPHAHFAGAPPEHERVTIYHDAAVAVRFSHPEEAPPVYPDDSGTGVPRERLFARIDVPPGAGAPRLLVEPVLPRISAESATVIQAGGDSWRTTTCVLFKVGSGRATQLALELPESSAAQFAIRSVPESRFTSRPGPEGHVTVKFYPDEPVLDRFVVVLTANIDRPLVAWQLPSIGHPGIEDISRLLIAPPGTFQSLSVGIAAEIAPVENWIKEILPAAALQGVEWYRLPAGARLEDLHPVQRDSLRTTVESSRLDLWIDSAGSIEGWLGLKFAPGVPAVVELDWPRAARPKGLSVNEEFQSPPVPVEGRISVAVPGSAREREVWVSWNDRPGPLPSIAGSLAARVPWPRALPVESCRVEVHPPQGFRVEGQAPLIAVATTPQRDNLPASLASPRRDDEMHVRHTVMTLFPVPEPGQPFELGALLRIVNESARSLLLALAIVIPAALLLWRAGTFWHWLMQHETTSWLLLSAFWWLCLAPSWLGLVIALWAAVRAFRDRGAVADLARVPPQVSPVP